MKMQTLRENGKSKLRKKLDRKINIKNDEMYQVALQGTVKRISPPRLKGIICWLFSLSIASSKRWRACVSFSLSTFCLAKVKKKRRKRLEIQWRDEKQLCAREMKISHRNNATEICYSEHIEFVTKLYRNTFHPVIRILLSSSSLFFSRSASHFEHMQPRATFGK